ncbi:uncharacterized protein EURHEDRAFT_129816 [Aspergillus ruber CBS 135680]|uniref:Uncharacterized protein n=1 Tax=Aspergillus ruber (strain CBS 135680) TaxID=1388766 RepID=A0A017SQC2_ASPRC|nr:uncharacterized protein EURHEDRAFT_129816 [Aspergillus ruber CBS 135680]EYE99168.1 hypothetical protein EURHEDRAFT_129816 [Aspergillus ruber CBS 135680]
MFAGRHVETTVLVSFQAASHLSEDIDYDLGISKTKITRFTTRHIYASRLLLDCFFSVLQMKGAHGSGKREWIGKNRLAGAGGSLHSGKTRGPFPLAGPEVGTLPRSGRTRGYRRFQQGAPRMKMIMATDEKHRFCSNRHSKSDSNSRIRQLIEGQS